MAFLLRLSANKFAEDPSETEEGCQQDVITIWSGSIRHLLGIVHLATIERPTSEVAIEERLWVRTVLAKIINYIVRQPTSSFVPALTTIAVYVSTRP